ncbi:DUF1631 family protein [Luteimonas deserti]|uniref:DUF1631 family protein n=1 Tax=Luteimonas deserti TaxID=2752306 RepID=A0A7Z0QP15_9GAMM|nr:DUF1631 family protein [Luteimonas deserti]NYZ61664.1 DUF1631 family protein [Luteimonas deserti]
MPGFTMQGTGDGSRAETPAQVLDSLRREATARLLPLLGETLKVERLRLEAERLGDVQDARIADAIAEDLAGVSVLGSELIRHEQRWQKSLTEVFAAWPAAPVARSFDQFSLLSEDQLQAQLIGQPVSEALDRRFESVRSVIDQRLYTVSASMGYRQRPSNPLAARFMVDCFLAAFDAQACARRLRASLLRRYEALLDAHLGALYAWCNTRLAEAGYAMAGDGDHSLLASSLGAPPDGGSVARTRIWEDGNALAPARHGWQTGGPVTAGRSGMADAPRGNLLRRHARTLRDARRAELDAASRSFRPEEFQAALSLLQSERSLPMPGAAHAVRMREGLYRVAGGLGIDRHDVAFDPDQDDAISLVGGLFDLLADRHLLLPASRERLAVLTLPYLHLALEDPQLFETSTPPSMQLLSLLVDLWDGADDQDEQSKELLVLADRASAAVIDGAHGDGRVFPAQLAQIDAVLGQHRRRAEAVERRTWQALRGRERLEAARRQAAIDVADRLRDRPLLPTVAAFLDGEWRQALVQAWLRDGVASDRYREVLSLGDALVEVDALAAGSGGSAVADRLLGILPALRECCVQCGVDETATDAQLSGLVAEHASPTPRSVHVPDDGDPDGGDASSLSDLDREAAAGFAEGQRFVQPGASGPGRVLRLAWRSALTGGCLLVNAAGAKELLLSPIALRARAADGRLQPRPLAGPVPAALDEMARRARSGS